MASIVRLEIGIPDVVVILLPFRLRLHMVGVVKHDAAFLERADVALVGMLVKRQQHVRLVPGAQDFAGADADLENRGPAGNRGGDGHEGHDFLLAASGQARQEAADGLDAILGIAGDADDRLVDGGNLGRAARIGSR